MENTNNLPKSPEGRKKEPLPWDMFVCSRPRARKKLLALMFLDLAVCFS